jgi:hypothetical protein
MAASLKSSGLSLMLRSAGGVDQDPCQKGRGHC